MAADPDLPPACWCCCRVCAVQNTPVEAGARVPPAAAAVLSFACVRGRALRSNWQKLKVER